MRSPAPLLALVGLLLPAAASAQSAAEILGTAVERWEARLADIDNYTVVQSVNGMSFTVYFEKRMQDGHPVLEPRIIGGQNLPAMPQGAQARTLEPNMLARFNDRAVLDGTESVGGRSAWVLRIDDLSGMDLGAEAEDFAPEGMTIHLDQQDYVPLQMTMSGQLTRNGQSHPVTMTTRMEDYRDVQGVLYPFRTITTMDGMMGAMSEEERSQMEEMKKRLAEMPPEQRTMMEQQMKNMPHMRAMMEQMGAASEGGAFETTMQVEEIRVNQGPPAGR